MQHHRATGAVLQDSEELAEVWHIGTKKYLGILSTMCNMALGLIRATSSCSAVGLTARHTPMMTWCARSAFELRRSR